MSTKKKIHALFTTIICAFLTMSLILTGCGGGGGGSAVTTAATQSQAAATTAANQTQATTTAAAPAAVDKTKITSWDDPNISWRQVADTPVEIECYIDYDWFEVDTWGKDEISQEITKMTGVSLKVHKSSDLNQLGVLFAADQLPEMIFTTNLVERYYDTDFVYPWDELIAEYCPEFVNLLDPVEIINNTRPDGHYYTIRTHYNSAEAWADPRNTPSSGSSHIAWRRDVMEELGILEITSVEELMDAFATVKAQKPEMIVYAPQATWENTIMLYMDAREGLGAVIKDGKLSLAYNSPRSYEWLVFLNNMVRSGYINPEFYTYKTQQWEEVVKQGDTFACSYNASTADVFNKYYDEHDMQGKWFVHPKKPLTYKGEMVYQPVDGGIGWSNLFITKKCKNPDRAITFMEFLKSPKADAMVQWGIEGYHYTMNEDGLFIKIKGHENRPKTETGIGGWILMASGLGEAVHFMSTKVGPTPQYSQCADTLQAIKPYYIRDPARAFIQPFPDTDELNIRVKLVETYNNVKIPMYSASSEAELKELYDKFCADAERIGAQKLIDYQQKAYDEAKKRYEK